jgi:hypothetical protein
MSKTIKLAKLMFVSPTTTLFAATDTAAVAVLHPGTFQQINEGAAASKGERVSAFRPFDQFGQKTFCLIFIITIEIFLYKVRTTPGRSNHTTINPNDHKQSQQQMPI